VKVTCKDGRDFIRDVITQSLSDPFPEYAGPKLSIRERQKEQLELKIARKILSISNFTPAPPDLPPRPRISHFVMNLPDSAITFLDAFRGILLSPEGLERSDISGVYHVMPMIHCYCFTRELEFDKAVVDIREVRFFLAAAFMALTLFFCQRVEEKLGCPLGGQISFHMVRSVAPNKDMYCISFRLPRKVAFGV
jgi:tRNA (guanine37-N1)-methyltransferase